MINSSAKLRNSNKLIGKFGLEDSAQLLIRHSPPRPSKIYDTYWKFACARQDLYLNRLSGTSGPWTADPILTANRFTNVYRAADRVSQYLIRNVIYAEKFDCDDTFFRILLFKLFNKIETWELLEGHFGRLAISTFDVKKFDFILKQAMSSKLRIYSAAYIMPAAGGGEKGGSKHASHLLMLGNLITSNFFEDIQRSKCLEETFNKLLGISGIGPFLAYQFSIDLNYSQYLNFSEDDFVQPGPGALHGLAKCFESLGDYSPADTIKWVKDSQESEFAKRQLTFENLWGRRLHLIDCQNLFCEVDKYSRVAHPEFNELTGRSRIKQRFQPAGRPVTPWFPPKWKLEVSVPRLQFVTPLIEKTSTQSVLDF